MNLVLPTPNDALFRGQGSRFYMYTDRTFEGRKSTPWQAGKYGYVRNPKRTGGGLVFTRFHEGVDIAPTKRDANGEPLDLVYAVSDGRVVHTATVSSRSSYGKYVVVEHDWGYGPLYTLYAHLMTITVQPGQRVRAGASLGRLGYTGNGINRRRAHLHLEFNLLLNRRYPVWHGKNYSTPNHHSTYNGLNLAGLDVAGLYLAHRKDPNLTVPAFIARMSPYYKVAVPQSRGFDLLQRYPWLRSGGRGSAWEITFSRSGVPLAVAATGRKVSAPTVTWVQPSPHAHAWNARSRLTGSGKTAGLSKGGQRYVQLVAGLF